MTTSAHVIGDFFLAMPASACRARDGTPGALFMVREPAPSLMFPEGLVAAWLGAEAEAFLHAHNAELKPGRGLRLTLVNLRAAREGELRARVQTCELLPPPSNWRKDPITTTPQAQPA